MDGERIEIPLVIGGEEVHTGRDVRGGHAAPPRARPRRRRKGGAEQSSGRSPPPARRTASWSQLPWEERAAVFLRAAELLAGPWRATLNAATMLGQSKTAHQAEIDAACELIDFWRFNVEFMTRIYAEQPVSSPGHVEPDGVPAARGLRLRGDSPFNFTAIGGNLPGSAALMGNTVVWKPASTAALLRALRDEAASRRPASADGVINLVYGSGAAIGDPALASPELAGIHFTGSTAVFHGMWKTVGDEHRALPQLPAHRRRDGRQGLHRRPSVRRRRGGRDGDRPRLVRVPGPEVLGLRRASTRRRTSGPRCASCSRRR